MSFSVEENAVFIDEFSKNLPTVAGGTPPSHTLPGPPPRSLRSLGRGVGDSWTLVFNIG